MLLAAVHQDRRAKRLARGRKALADIGLQTYSGPVSFRADAERALVHVEEELVGVRRMERLEDRIVAFDRDWVVRAVINDSAFLYGCVRLEHEYVALSSADKCLTWHNHWKGRDKRTKGMPGDCLNEHKTVVVGVISADLLLVLEAQGQLLFIVELLSIFVHSLKAVAISNGLEHAHRLPDLDILRQLRPDFNPLSELRQNFALEWKLREFQDYFCVIAL